MSPSDQPQSEDRDAEHEMLERAMRLRGLMNDYLRNMSDAERDRLMQVHLAEARGPEINAYLFRKAMNFAIRLRLFKRDEEET